jgi:hypothetical protein
MLDVYSAFSSLFLILYYFLRFIPISRSRLEAASPCIFSQLPFPFPHGAGPSLCATRLTAHDVAWTIIIVDISHHRRPITTLRSRQTVQILVVEVKSLPLLLLQWMRSILRLPLPCFEPLVVVALEADQVATSHVTLTTPPSRAGQ